MIFIGIDPGKGGGVCYVNTEPDRDFKTCEAYGCPETIRDMADLLGKLLLYESKKDCNCVIEKVHSMPGQEAHHLLKLN